MLPLADEEAVALLASVREEARGECWWLVLADGTPIAGDRGGGVALLRVLWLTRPLGALLGALRLAPLVDRLDTLIAGQRSRLGRFIPEGPAPRRYP